MGDPRFERQLTTAVFSRHEMERISAAHVVVAGAGGLGSPVATYLAASGVGKLTIIDCDTVELTNYNRQFMHRLVDLGRPKADSASRFLSERYDATEVRFLNGRIEAQSVGEMVGLPTVVADCLDNYASRSVLQTYCENARVPLYWGAVGGINGFMGGGRDGFATLFPEPDDSDMLPASVGVVGAICGAIGALLALRVLGLIARPGSDSGGIVHMSGWQQSALIMSAV